MTDFVVINVKILLLFNHLWCQKVLYKVVFNMMSPLQQKKNKQYYLKIWPVFGPSTIYCYSRVRRHPKVDSVRIILLKIWWNFSVLLPD